MSGTRDTTMTVKELTGNRHLNRQMDFAGSTVIETPHFQCRGGGFHPGGWAGGEGVSPACGTSLTEDGQAV